MIKLTAEMQAKMRAALKKRPSESSDDYPYVVVLEGKQRVIECADGLQWIVQKKAGSSWHSHSFCRTKTALLRCTPIKSQLLDDLPDEFPEMQIQEMRSSRA